MTNKLPELLPNHIIQRVMKLNTTLLSDAMDGTGGMDYRIKPVAKDTKFVGTAVTVELSPADNLFLHKAIYSGKEGYVLVVDGQGVMSHAYLGELMTKAAKAVGIKGIVIDGAIRDKEVLEELGFPVFAKGCVPNGPYKNGPGEMNKQISCGGVAVSPGDLVVGDADGVTVVPKDRIVEVLLKAEAKLKYEKERIKIIQDFEEKRSNGEDPGSIEPKWLGEKLKLYRYE